MAAQPGASAGGAETQMLMVARGLAARGLRAALVVFERDGVEVPSALDGIEVITIRQPRSRHAPFRMVERLWTICNTVWRLRSSVLVQRIAGPETGLLAVLSRLRRHRFVYSSASVVDFDFARLRPGRVKLWLFHLGVRLAHAVVVQTPEQVELCRRRFGRTPLMIKSVAEPAALSGRRPEAFLWVGRTDWYKHPEAYVELARALPQVRFRMVAMPMNEEGASRIDALAQEARELPNLELLPPRPRAELMRLVDEAVAVVNTSDYEGMPNVFLEGWARGVPALALTHDPDGVIVREGLGAYAGGSVTRLAELAAELWDRRDDQAALTKRCRDYVEREHSVDAVIDRWLGALGLA